MNTFEETKQIKNKEKTKMKTSKIETIKTIVITALVAGILAFIAGVVYAGSVHEQIKSEATNIVKNVKVEAEIQPSKK